MFHRLSRDVAVNSFDVVPDHREPRLEPTARALDSRRPGRRRLTVILSVTLALMPMAGCGSNLGPGADASTPPSHAPPRPKASASTKRGQTVARDHRLTVCKHIASTVQRTERYGRHFVSWTVTQTDLDEARLAERANPRLAKLGFADNIAYMVAAGGVGGLGGVPAAQVSYVCRDVLPRYGQQESY